MFKTSIVFAALISQVVLAQSALAQGEPAKCTAVRQGTAHVTVARLHWLQEKGSYKLISEKACEVTSPVRVLPGNAGGCMTPVLASCALTMDGQPHLLNVSGEVIHNENGPKRKTFSLGYHLDRNTTEVTTGEAASTGVQTEDLSLKKLQIQMQSKMDSPGPHSSTRDAFDIIVDIEDTNAP